ncbi:MAG: hypothetical protein ACXWH0_16925 [Acidimicrobiia bacterium]
MVIGRGHEGGGQWWARRHLAKVTSLALGVAMFGTVGLSGALAQDDNVSVEEMIDQIFAEISGGDVTDDPAVSGGGDLNLGGSSGSTITMGGDGDVTIGGGSSGSGATMGDNDGG